LRVLDSSSLPSHIVHIREEVSHGDLKKELLSSTRNWTGPASC
jgi:hypothetical protein